MNPAVFEVFSVESPSIWSINHPITVIGDACLRVRVRVNC